MDVVLPNMQVKSVSYKRGSPSPLPGAYDLFLSALTQPQIHKKYVSVKSQSHWCPRIIAFKSSRSWVKMVTTYVDFFFVLEVNIFESLI